MATQEQLLKENTQALKQLTTLLREEAEKEEDKAGEDPKTDIQKKRNKAIEEGNKLLSERQEQYKNLMKTQNDIYDQRKESRLEYEAALKREQVLLRKLKKASGERKKLLKEQLASVREITEEYQKQESGWSKLKGGANKFLDGVQKIYRAVKDISNALATAAKDFQEFDAGVFKMDSAKEAANNLDKLSVELRKTTGLSRDFVKELKLTKEGMYELGMTSEDVSATFGGLFSNLNDFSRLNKSQQGELTKATFGFTKLGISVEDTAKTLQFGTKTLGMSIEETIDLQEGLARTAMAIGIAPGQMVQQFATAAPRLAAHGRNMEKVFKGLALQSKATGVSMEGLLGVAQGFDTFEGAARQTAQLNAMFGTQLNSVELLNATETERIDIIKQGMLATGKSIDTLQRYEVKSLSQILGTDDESVRKMLGNTDDIMADLETKTQEANQIDLNKQIGKSVTAQEQLTASRQRDAEMIGEKILPKLKEMAHFQATNVEHMKNMERYASGMAIAMNASFEAAKNMRPILGEIALAQGATDLTDKGTALGTGVVGGLGTIGVAAGANRLMNKMSTKGPRSSQPTLAQRAGLASKMSRGYAPGALKAAKFGGRALGVAGAGIDAYMRHQEGQSAGQIGLGVGGGLAGALAGAKLGTMAGGAGGAAFAGIGAVPGALLGGLVGGIGGYFGGSYLGDKAAEGLGIANAPKAPSAPRPTPSATQSQQGAQAINALGNKISANVSQNFNPQIDIYAQVGDEKTFTKVVRTAINKGNSVNTLDMAMQG
jgi:hypothetical protein